MKLNLLKLSLVFILLVYLSACNNNNKMENIKPPVAEKIKKELTIHGDTRIDNYYWLNKRDNPKVIDYLKAENEYTKERLKHTEKFQEKLFNEIVGRIKQTDESVPYKNNGYYYYTRYEEGKEYPIYCRKKENLEANEEILINVNEMAKGYSYYQLTGLSVSMDNKLLSFGVDTVSRRKYTIYIKDIETGKIFTEKINNTTGRAVWANDNKTIFYTLKDETLRAYKILKHKLGEDVLNDKELFTETDETYYTYISKTKSNKYLIIKSKSTLSSEYRFLDADNTDGEFKIIQKREKDLEYSISHYKDKFYIVTNFNAKNFRLMETPVCKTDKENWKEIIPHRNDVLIKKIEVFNDYIVVSERENGLIQLKVIELKNNNEYFIDFGEETYEAYISVNYEFETNLLRYKYSSLTTPSSTFDFDMKTKEKKLLKQQEIIGDFNSDNYVSERLYANARDGKKVPISLVYRKGLEKNGNNPLLLYSYGSYGSSVEPYFSSIRLSLLDRGFVYAIAHIRGGQELGREWYEDGKLLNKKNTFTDFIDCAEYLIEQKFTNKSKLFALGGSAGGLLMGVIINMRPDLFKGVVAAVPFVDVVTTMLDEDIPLTTSEYDEWGNPNEKVYYDYMLSYSPYDNVEKMNYPAMLVTTGLHDSQVQYWEPAKWLAKLRDKKTDNNMLLLYTNMEYGHGGASGRFERYKEIALDYAFFLNLLDVNE